MMALGIVLGWILIGHLSWRGYIRYYPYHTRYQKTDVIGFFVFHLVPPIAYLVLLVTALGNIGGSLKRYINQTYDKSIKEDQCQD